MKAAFNDELLHKLLMYYIVGIWEADLGSASWVSIVTSCKYRERQCWVKDTNRHITAK